MDSSGWEPESDWEPAKRPWFKEAASNSGNVIYEEPYVDAITEEASELSSGFTLFTQSISNLVKNIHRSTVSKLK